MSVHPAGQPLEPGSTSSSGISAEWLGELLDWSRPAPAALGTVPLEFARAHSTPWGTVLGVDPVTPAPGWWVCPSCSRRIDRAGEPRTVTARYCTGPDDARRHRRHPVVAMEVQR